MVVMSAILGWAMGAGLIAIIVSFIHVMITHSNLNKSEKQDKDHE